MGKKASKNTATKLSARSELELTRQSLQQLVELLSHDARNPLAFISSMSKLMLDEVLGPVPDFLKDPLQRIYRNANRGLQGIDEVCLVSKLESASRPLHPEARPLRDLVAQAWAENQGQAKLRGLSLDLSAIPESTEVMVDGEYVGEALGKLFRWVVERAKRQSTLRTGTSIFPGRRSTDMGRVAHLSLELPVERLADDEFHHLLERYQKMESGVLRLAPSSALSLTREICVLHHGDLWLGRGTESLEIHLTLPHVAKSP